ncbi:MAG TPA: glycosyltransferase family 87 protein, partial [bacterium]|nr:glycosyltransferase family 87 protein [bacterium]HOL48362.1 glycosyltransferase family 87 protein [bacterium]HPQ19471.1 glycosyltransferase family 87 protein [bacterium]
MDKEFSNKIIITFFLIFSLFNFFYKGIIQAISGRKADFSTYYTAAIALKNKINPYNQKLMLNLAIQNNSFTLIQGRPTVHKYVYPPFLADLFISFTFIKFNFAKLLWTILINPLFIFFLLYLLYKKFFYDTFKFLFLFFSLMIFNPLYETIAFGQINIFLMLLIFLAIFFYKKNFLILSSFFLAISFYVKILPIILVLFFILIKNYKYLFYFICWLLFFLFLQIIFNDFNIVYQYFTKVLISFSKGAGVSFENLSFFTLINLFLFEPYLSIIFNFIIFIILIIIFINYKKTNNKNLLLFNSIMLTLFLPKTVWEHHYLLLFLIIPILVEENFWANKIIFFIFLFFWAYFAISLRFYNVSIIQLNFLKFFKTLFFVIFLFFVNSIFLLTENIPDMVYPFAALRIVS